MLGGGGVCGSPGGSVGPGAGLGELRGLADKGAAFEMIDGSAYNADKAYKVRRRVRVRWVWGWG